MATIWTITRLTFWEAARRKILWAALIMGIVYLAVYGLGFYFMLQQVENTPYGMSAIENREIFNFLTLAGMYVVNFLTIALSVLTSVNTISGEIISGTVQTIVTKPVKRWQIYLGKWLGFIGMITLYLVLMAGGTVLLVYLLADSALPNMLEGFFLLWLNGAIMLTLSLLGGVYLSTLANGVMAFGLFGIAFIGGWVEQIGSFMNSEVAVRIGVISSLIIPTEAVWKRAAYQMQSSLVRMIGFSPFTSGSVPSKLMIYYAIGFVLLTLFLGIRKFNRRDL